MKPTPVRSNFLSIIWATEAEAASLTQYYSQQFLVRLECHREPRNKFTSLIPASALVSSELGTFRF